MVVPTVVIAVVPVVPSPGIVVRAGPSAARVRYDVQCPEELVEKSTAAKGGQEVQ